MTPDSPRLTEEVGERRGFGDLSDDILREIADLLETHSDEGLQDIVLPTYETPRPFPCANMKYWRPCRQPASLPGHMRIGADVRALRRVCRRTAQAVSLAYFTDLAIKLKTMADIKTVQEAPYTVRMAARSLNFAIPWRVECADKVIRSAGSLEQVHRQNVSDWGSGCSELMTGIFDCLGSLPQIKRLSITMLPFASKDHPTQCLRIQSAIKKTRPHRLPSLDRLTSIEIACAKYECCPFCTSSVIDIFQEYIAQCDTVKLGVTPNFCRRATFMAKIKARALYVRVDRPDQGARGLFHALRLPSISSGTRKLVIHSTRHFINLKCLGDEITVEQVRGSWSFDCLTDLLRPWSAVEELDIRLRIRVPDDDRFISAYRSRAPDCAFWNLSIESGAEDFVAWYAHCLTHGTDAMDHGQIRRDQMQVLVRLADALPKLKKVWFWAKAPGRYDGDVPDEAKPWCWQRDALSSFRMAWTVDRSEEGERVYRREDGLEGPHPRSGQKRTIRPARLPQAGFAYM